MLDLRREFPSQWHRFTTPASNSGLNIFEFEASPDLFPIKDTGKTLKINSIWLMARCTDPGSYEVKLTWPLSGDSETFSLPEVNQYGGLHAGQKGGSALTPEVVPNDPPGFWRVGITRPRGGELPGELTLKNLEVWRLGMTLGY